MWNWIKDKYIIIAAIIGAILIAIWKIFGNAISGSIIEKLLTTEKQDAEILAKLNKVRKEIDSVEVSEDWYKERRDR